MRRAIAFAAVFLGACRAGEDYHAPELGAPPAFNAAAEDSELASAGELAAWWTRFDDPALDDLVERALANNLALKIAAARIRAARAGVGVVGGAARPQADLAVEAGRREPSTAVPGGEFLPQRDAPFYAAGFDARWELDLFGRTARQVEAAEAEHDVEVEAARGARLAVVAEVARHYFDLRAAEAEEALLRRELAAQAERRALVEDRVRAGLEDELSLARARALEAETETGLPELARRRAAAAHALGVLLGAVPGELAQELAQRPGALPAPPAVLPASLPLDCLRRRPDVRGAERALARASALRAQAVAELYPRVSLGAAFGWEAEQPSDLFDGPSKTFSAGPSLLAPLLSGGVLRFGLRARDAQEEEARLTLELSVLSALAEIEDALVAERRSGERRVALQAAREAHAATLALARDRWSAGLEDYLGVLDAERGFLAAETALVRGASDHAEAAAALYKSLGGGWEGPSAPGPSAAGL
jgi:NodT family efflux transporter outer membrane factor (OMF) lipoprotein